jgi:hypothetical protein
MKFNTDTESGKLQDALWKQQYNISRSINSIYQNTVGIKKLFVSISYHYCQSSL